MLRLRLRLLRRRDGGHTTGELCWRASTSKMMTRALRLRFLSTMMLSTRVLSTTMLSTMSLVERTPIYRFRRSRSVRVCLLPLMMAGTSGLRFLINTSRSAWHSRNSSARASNLRTRVAPRDRQQETVFHHFDGDVITTLSRATSSRFRTTCSRTRGAILPSYSPLSLTRSISEGLRRRHWESGVRQSLM